MALNPNIILAGQAPDIMGALATSNQAAQQRLEFDNQNALRAMMREQGPGIMAGDPNALNALAQFDPRLALGVQSDRLGLDAARQDIAFTSKKMAALDTATQREAEAYAKSISAEQAAAEAAALEASVKQALMAPTPEAFDALMVQSGQPELVGQFENREMLGAQFMSVAEILKMNAGPEPQSSAGKLAADLAAGVITPEQYQAEIARTAPKGTSLTVDPTTGAVTFQEGAGVSGTTPTVGQVYNPNEVASVVTMIDEIADNPNLDRVLGPVEGGGGNNIDDLGAMARAYYGGEGTALIERIGQLQNNAWLSARQMLKGGGAITDYESRKAEGAVARLSRAKSEAEFRTALKDLRDAITEGEAKLRGTAPAAPAAPTAPTAAPAAPQQTAAGTRRLKFNPETGELE